MLRLSLSLLLCLGALFSGCSKGTRSGTAATGPSGNPALGAPEEQARGRDRTGSGKEEKPSPAGKRAPAARAEEPTPPGQWRKFRTHKFDPGLTKEQREAMERLEGIGYAAGSVPAGKDRGVTVFDPKRAFAGYNFYTSGHGQEAVLMDMTGRVLHTWSCDFWKIWPDYPIADDHEMTRFWRRAYLYGNGDILVIYEGLGIVKLDKDSNVLWAAPCRAHHDLCVMPGGDIYVLTREARLARHGEKEQPILEDFITRLGPDGREKERVSLLECLERSEFKGLLKEKNWMIMDLFHTNSLEVLDGRLAPRLPGFRKGNILTSMLTLDAIAVVDLEKKKMVWAWHGPFDKQHDPKVLENGDLLVFNNNRRTGRSAVLELDPVERTVKWKYEGTPEVPFYSKTCGTAQRLPNGNTLITESDNGRAFEVTPDHAIVWNFYNPHRAGKKGEYIAALFEVVRLRPRFPLAWAEKGRD